MKGEREIKKMGKKYVGMDTAERNPVQETNKSFLYTSTATISKLTLIESSYFANTSKINRSLSVKHTVKEIPTDLSFLSHSPSVSPAPDLAGVQNHILGDPSALWRATLAGLKAAGPVQAPTSVHCSNGALLMTQRKACNFL